MANVGDAGAGGQTPSPSPPRPSASASVSAALDRHDLGLSVACNAVLDGSQRMIRSLADEQAAVLSARGRVASLRHSLAEQEVATEAAMRDAFLARVRILQAERIIGKAQGRFPGAALSGVLLAVQEAEEDRLQGLSESQALQASRRDRDACRGVALQLMSRVHTLGDLASGGAGTGAGTPLAAYSRLVDLMERAAADLDSLRGQHLSLCSAVAEAAAADGGADAFTDADPRPDPGRPGPLEARWIAMTSSLDGFREGKSKTVSAVPGWSPAHGRTLLSDTERRSVSLHQLCLDIEEVCSLLE